MQFLEKAATKLSGNGTVQRFLKRTVDFSQFLMGIGSGTSVESSGEKVVLDLLRRRFQPPYCVFDVGSNKGQYLGLVLRTVPKSHLKVHCFEPSCYAMDILKRNLDLTYEDRVVLNNLALGELEGEMTLYSNQPGSELASLTKRRLQHFGIDFNSSETVKVDTLDSYCHEKEISRIHLLKCDVEGHELDVFRGGSDMFESGRIGIVTFEFGGCNIDTRTFFQDFYYFFKEIKMNMFRITPSGYLSPIDSYTEIDEQFRTTNFVAIRNG